MPWKNLVPGARLKARILVPVLPGGRARTVPALPPFGKFGVRNLPLSATCPPKNLIRLSLPVAVRAVIVPSRNEFITSRRCALDTPAARSDCESSRTPAKARPVLPAPNGPAMSPKPDGEAPRKPLSASNASCEAENALRPGPGPAHRRGPQGARLHPDRARRPAEHHPGHRLGLRAGEAAPAPGDDRPARQGPARLDRRAPRRQAAEPERGNRQPPGPPPPPGHRRPAQTRSGRALPHHRCLPPGEAGQLIEA